MIGVGDGASATSGANMRAVDTGVVGVGLNGERAIVYDTVIGLSGGSKTSLVADVRADLSAP